MFPQGIRKHRVVPVEELPQDHQFHPDRDVRVEFLPPQFKIPDHPTHDSSEGSALLPSEPKARKDIPMARGLLDYFPRALAAVAELSRVGNDQHNPGQPMHWAVEKSIDHADSLLRHLAERGGSDSDKVLHSVKVAWRALAHAEIELRAIAGDPEAIRQINEVGTKAQKEAVNAR